MAGLLDKAKQYVVGSVTSIEKPEASVTDVDLKKVDWSSVTYVAKVKVSNPYSVSIPIGEIRYSLKSADRFVCYNFVDLVCFNCHSHTHFYIVHVSCRGYFCSFTIFFNLYSIKIHKDQNLKINFDMIKCKKKLIKMTKMSLIIEIFND